MVEGEVVWFDGEVIGISGCTRSGKSTLASALAEALGASKTAVIRQDRFASNVLAAQAEGGWESTDSIDFKAFDLRVAWSTCSTTSSGSSLVGRRATSAAWRRCP